MSESFIKMSWDGQSAYVPTKQTLDSRTNRLCEVTYNCLGTSDDFTNIQNIISEFMTDTNTSSAIQMILNINGRLVYQNGNEILINFNNGAGTSSENKHIIVDFKNTYFDISNISETNQKLINLIKHYGNYATLCTVTIRNLFLLDTCTAENFYTIFCDMSHATLHVEYCNIWGNSVTIPTSHASIYINSSDSITIIENCNLDRIYARGFSPSSAFFKITGCTLERSIHLPDNTELSSDGENTNQYSKYIFANYFVS